MSDQPYKDEELRDFLESLDSSELTPNEWEVQFIADNMDAIAFTPKQRESIREMIDKYGKRIGWL